MKLKAEILDASAISRSLMRISHEILEKNASLENMCIVGIKTRGVPIAEMIAENIYKIEKKRIPTGVLDITLYRDDLSHISENPIVNGTQIDFDITDKNIILVDDVIYTGRTVRAAMEAIMSMGRPERIQLAVMIDRGHRELPIRADYVCKNVPTSHREIIKVNLDDTDKKTSVELFDNE